MGSRVMIGARCLFVLSVCFVSTGNSLAGGRQAVAPWAVGRGMQIGPVQNVAPPDETAAFKAFVAETVVDTRIQLGEQFDLMYPRSSYAAWVDDALTFLYYNRSDLPKFYAIADKTISENPDDEAVLRLVGWAIPRDYDPTTAGAAARLDKAERYEKRALVLVARMKKSKTMTDDDFAQEKASSEWQVHSGLGMIYYRRKNFAESVAEFQIAASQESPAPDPDDLYVLAVELQNLGRTADASAAFTECAGIAGDLQERCKNGIANAAEEAAYATFRDETDRKKKIELGENFDKQFPASQYEEPIDSVMVLLYSAQEDWPGFYRSADRILTKHPDNAAILAYVGWTIPRVYDAAQPGAEDLLTQAERYDKHALDLISTMDTSGNLGEQDFEQAKLAATWQAHSGLGLAYFRRGDFANSAVELEDALKDLQNPDQQDLYILGIDLHKLGRDRESAKMFGGCAGIAGQFQLVCKRDAAQVSAAQANGGESSPAKEVVDDAVANLQSVTFPEKTSDAVASGSGITVANGASAAASSDAAHATLAANIPPLHPPDATPQTSQVSGETIKSETISVPVRVVVRDKSGRAIGSLTKEDFELYQDGKAKEILNFTTVRVGSANTENTSASVPNAEGANGKFDSVASSSKLPAAKAAQYVALFFDDVHIYFRDSAPAAAAAEKYIGQLGPEYRVAIVTASGEDEIPFTNDHGKLDAALKKLIPHPFTGGSMHPTDAKCPPPMTYMEAEAIAVHNSDPVVNIAGDDFAACNDVNPDAGKALAKSAASQAHIAGEQAIDRDLQQLNDTIRRLAVLPGQRSVVLVSPGFMYGNHAAEFAELTNAAIRYGVVINTLDAKAIWTSLGGWDPDRFARFGYGELEESEVMIDLADGTGGLYIHFNNDLAGAMRDMSVPAENYYLLAYAPGDLANDGKFHSLKVSLQSKPGYSVQARKGFFAPTRAQTPQETEKRDIENALYSNDEQHELPVKFETQLLTPDSDGAELLVKVHVDASQLHFVNGNGINREELATGAAIFDSDGNYVDSVQKVQQMALDGSTLAELTNSGFFVEMDLKLKPGSYVVRLVARDSNDQHISAESADVTVPN